jgi:hypothetical protein
MHETNGASREAGEDGRVPDVVRLAPPGSAGRKSRSARALATPPRVVPLSDACHRGMHCQC